VRIKNLLWASLLAASVNGVGRSADWPQFRGPNGSATSAEAHLPTEWGADKNIDWKVNLPGYGWSSPVVWGDKVFVTTAVTDKQVKPGGGRGMMFGKKQDAVYKWEVHCLSTADGKSLWKQTAAEKKPDIATNPTNGYATETPVTDGDRVYAYFGAIGMVYCFDFTGKPLWNADLGAYPTQMNNGTGSSPVLADGRLFVQCDNEEKSFLVALDVKTGRELWHSPRDERTGWSTPLVWKNTARTEIVCIGSPRVRSYDPETGKQLWELGGITGQVKSSGVADNDLLYVGSGGGFGGFGGGPGGFFRGPGGGDGGPGNFRRGPGGGDDGPGEFPRGARGGGDGGPGGFPRGPGGGGGSRPMFAVRAGASGDITLKQDEKTNAGVAWHLATAGAATPSPLLYAGYLYVLEEKGGIVSCYDAKTGNKLYKERVPGARGFTASPWAFAEKVFCLDEDGTTWVLKAGPKFEVIGENKIGELAWSSPAAANGALFLRTVDNLYCIREPRNEK
jgi:outer membrane protein assembly factor BamB